MHCIVPFASAAAAAAAAVDDAGKAALASMRSAGARPELKIS